MALLRRRPNDSGEKKIKDITPPGTYIPPAFKIISAFTLVFLIFPAVIVILAAVNAGDYLAFPPQGFSLKWVEKFLREPYFHNAYLFSLRIAAITAVISTVLGTMAAMTLARILFRGRAIVRSSFVMPLMLPGVVLGLALYTFYIEFHLPFFRSLSGLLIGHVILTMPFVIGTVTASLANFDVSLEQAARSLGASPLQAFLKVTLPIINAGVIAGFVFAFIMSFGAFDISLFLATPDLTPLPIAMYDSLRYQFEPTVAAAGAFAIFLVIVSTLIINKLIDIRRFAGISLR